MERLMRIGAGSILGASLKRQQASREYKYNIQTERAIQKAAGQKIAAAIKRQTQKSIPTPDTPITVNVGNVGNVGNAATKIQTAVRKRQAKQKVSEMLDTRDIQNIIIPSIQSAVRGRIARKKVQVLREGKRIKNAPAIKIAKVIKGAAVRKTIKPIIENLKKEVKNIEKDKLLETAKVEDRINYEKKLIAANKVGLVGGLFASNEDKTKKQQIIDDAERAIKAEQLRLKNIEKQAQRQIIKKRETAQKQLEARTDKDYNDIYKLELNSALASGIQYKKQRKIDKEKNIKQIKQAKAKESGDKLLAIEKKEYLRRQTQEIDKINRLAFPRIKKLQDDILLVENNIKAYMKEMKSMFLSTKDKERIQKEIELADRDILKIKENLKKKEEERISNINKEIEYFDNFLQAETYEELLYIRDKIKEQQAREEEARIARNKAAREEQERIEQEEERIARRKAKEEEERQERFDFITKQANKAEEEVVINEKGRALMNAMFGIKKQAKKEEEEVKQEERIAKIEVKEAKQAKQVKEEEERIARREAKEAKQAKQVKEEAERIARREAKEAKELYKLKIDAEIAAKKEAKAFIDNKNKITSIYEPLTIKLVKISQDIDDIDIKTNLAKKYNKYQDFKRTYNELLAMYNQDKEVLKDVAYASQIKNIIKEMSDKIDKQKQLISIEKELQKQISYTKEDVEKLSKVELEKILINGGVLTNEGLLYNNVPKGPNTIRFAFNAFNRKYN
jgi:trichohyalin